MANSLLVAQLAYLRRVMAEKGWDATRLAREAGVAQTTITRPLNHPDWPHAISARTMNKVVTASGVVPPPDLVVATAPDVPSGSARDVSPGTGPTLSPLDLPKDVPVFGVAAGSFDGAFNLEEGIIDYVRRPPGIALARDVYALYVTQDSMSPRYRHGDLVYVAPRRPVGIGDYCIVLLHAKGDGDPPDRLIKLLKRRTAREIIVEQHNPAQELKIPATRVMVLHKVLDWNDLLGV